MKKILMLLICATILVSAGSSWAGSSHSGFGLGLMAGEPSGLSAKLWSSEKTAFDFGLAWSSKNDATMAIHADYVWHRFDKIDVDQGALPFYYGIGVRFRGNDVADDFIGVRFPLGLDYLFANSAFDVFIEVAPVLDLTPDTDIDINAALGGRFFF